MRPIDVEVAGVWRDRVRVGSIRRSTAGSAFEYDEAFFEEHRSRPGGVALHLPWGRRIHETHGVNLHPYFAGLLPEGLRLRRLVARIKTSEDDLLSLLLAAGGDTIGDLSVLAEGQEPDEPGPTSTWQPEQVLFSQLFEKSLEGAEPEPVVPGVQEKISASTISFPVVASKRASFILKLNPPDKPGLVENEAWFMGMARACGLRVAETRLVADRGGNSGLLVRRFDRAWSPEEGRLTRIHQEDACQFLNRYPADKYRLSCREIAEGIAEFSLAPIPEIARFLRLVAFSYVIANGDLHAKNVSLLADGPDGGLRLAPAYDLLSTLPYGDDRMALRFEGRDTRLRRKDFLAFGARFGVREAATVSLLNDLCTKAARWVVRVDEIGLEQRKTAWLRRTMEKRLADLA